MLWLRRSSTTRTLILNFCSYNKTRQGCENLQISPPAVRACPLPLLYQWQTWSLKVQVQNPAGQAKNKKSQYSLLEKCLLGKEGGMLWDADGCQCLVLRRKISLFYCSNNTDHVSSPDAFLKSRWYTFLINNSASIQSMSAGKASCHNEFQTRMNIKRKCQA
jgi:hypothetical protein